MGKVVAVMTKRELSTFNRASGSRVMAEQITKIINNPILIGACVRAVIDLHQEVVNEIFEAHSLPKDKQYSINTATGEIELLEENKPIENSEFNEDTENEDIENLVNCLNNLFEKLSRR